MALPNIAIENVLKLPALVKIGQIVLLIIAVSIAQGGSSYPGFGGAVSVTLNVTTPDQNQTEQVLHCIDDKHIYFFGAGISLWYLINCLVLVFCYLLDDTRTQSSKFELVTSTLGSIFFLSVALKLLVGSGGDTGYGDSEDYTPKLVTEGCCCLGVAVLQIVDAIFIHRRIKKGDDGW